MIRYRPLRSAKKNSGSEIARRRFSARRFGPALGVFFILPSVARAQTVRDFTVEQGPEWYLTHGALTVGASGLAVALGRMDPRPARWNYPAEFEVKTIDNQSEFAAEVSDIAVLSTVGAPFLLLLAETSDVELVNLWLVYSETISFNWALTNLAKLSFSRVRPSAVRAGVWVPDDARSFFSGHAAASYTAAMAGGVLLSSVEGSGEIRAAQWALGFGLAALAAQSRVQAGRHYPSDVILGAFVGVTMGALVPALHGVEYRFELADIAAIGGGTLLGWSLGLVLPNTYEWAKSSFLGPLKLESQGTGLVVRGKF